MAGDAVGNGNGGSSRLSPWVGHGLVLAGAIGSAFFFSGGLDQRTTVLERQIETLQRQRATDDRETAERNIAVGRMQAGIEANAALEPRLRALENVHHALDARERANTERFDNSFTRFRASLEEVRAGVVRLMERAGIMPPPRANSER